MQHSAVRAHLPDKQDQLKDLLNSYSVVAGINTTVVKEDEELIAPTGPTDRQSLGHTTGSTGAAISVIRRPGRQRSKVRILFEPG